MNRGFYAFAKGLFTAYFALLCPIEVTGAENIPDEGGVMLCCNHVSVMDPIVLAVINKRPMTFMAKQEWFKNPLLRAVFEGLGAIPVNRGAADIASVRKCMQTLSEGRLFGIFPQGTRNPEGIHDPSKRKPVLSGAAMMAHRTNAAVIPVLLPDRFRVLRKNRVLIGPRVPLGKTVSETTKGIEEGIWGMLDC